MQKKPFSLNFLGWINIGTWNEQKLVWIFIYLGLHRISGQPDIRPFLVSGIRPDIRLYGIYIESRSEMMEHCYWEQSKTHTSKNKYFIYFETEENWKKKWVKRTWFFTSTKNIFLGRYLISGRISAKIVGRISGQFSIRCNPNNQQVSKTPFSYEIRPENK